PAWLAGQRVFRAPDASAGRADPDPAVARRAIRIDDDGRRPAAGRVLVGDVQRARAEIEERVDRVARADGHPRTLAAQAARESIAVRAERAARFADAFQGNISVGKRALKEIFLGCRSRSAFTTVARERAEPVEMTLERAGQHFTGVRFFATAKGGRM